LADPTDFDLSPAMSLLMHDLHNVLGRHLQVYRVDESGLDSFEKTILLVVSFFSILQTLTSACDKFHWSEFPTFVTFVKHGSTMMAQYAGALSLRDWTWLHHLGLESSQSEVDKENAQLKSEMQRGFAASHLRHTVWRLRSCTKELCLLWSISSTCWISTCLSSILWMH